MDDFFENMRAHTEAACLDAAEPWKQSGFSGPEERWIALRRPIADCIDRPGTFLDVGCANGYLAQCVLGWTAARNIALTPYGIDLSPALVARARERLPAYAEHFVVANAIDWQPPMRFDWVRTELVYVPAERQREYLQRLLERVVAPDGALLVANYLEGRDDQRSHIDEGAAEIVDIVSHLASLGLPPRAFCDGVDLHKGRRTRVAIVRD